jgi:hypothetical protein
MKYKILLLFIFLFSLASVSAMINYCGDGVCDNYDYYNETNPRDALYCTTDCGLLVTSIWCEDTFNLTTPRECPTCPTCPTCPLCGGSTECTTSRLTSAVLGGWCTSNGYTTGTCGTSSTITNKNVYWLVFFVIGYLTAYFIHKKSKKKKR